MTKEYIIFRNGKIPERQERVNKVRIVKILESRKLSMFL